jgi:cytochrome c
MASRLNECKKTPAKRTEHMLNIEIIRRVEDKQIQLKRTQVKSFATAAAATLTAVMAIWTLGANAQTAQKKIENSQSASGATKLVGDADRGAEQFEATCAECHGAAATAPTLRGIIGRPVASIQTFYGYSEAMKAKKPMTWTVENLDTYLKSPPTFVPGNLMYREYPDAQMRADIIAFLATLPPPR